MATRLQIDESNVSFHAAHKATRRSLVRTYLRSHRKVVPLTLSVLLLGGAAAGVVLTQVVGVSPNAITPDVIFATGDDYVDINNLGFATLSLGSSATSASLTINGIPGASDLQLVNLLNITNQGSEDYSVTLGRSASLDTEIDNFTVTVKNAADTTITTWYAKDAASASSFTLPAGSTYTIDIRFLIDDGVVAGSLDSFDFEFGLSEV